MLKKEAFLDSLDGIIDVLTPGMPHGILESEGGSILGGKLAHVGYGAGLYKLHKYLNNRYKQKILDELTGVLHKKRFML